MGIFFMLPMSFFIIMPSGIMQHIIMLPHIIIMGMPIFIMLFICSQHCFIMSIDMPPIGIMVHTMPLEVISQVMPIIIMGIIIGIMLPIIPGIIWGIMPFIMGMGIICIWGIIIGIWPLGMFIMGSVSGKRLTNGRISPFACVICNALPPQRIILL